MCVFPKLAAKICVLVIIPITGILCLTEMTITFVSLNAEKATKSLLYLVLLTTVLYLIALGAGYYGAIVQNIAFLQVMLFVIAAYVLIKIFVSIICSNRGEKDKEIVTNLWFFGSFAISVLCFLFTFLYFLRIKELVDDDG